MAFVLLALALLAGSVYSSPTRIVGGAPTTIDRYPSIVQVESLGVFSGVWGQSCAANILTSRFVLSAAHCFAGIFYHPENRRIRAGSTYRNSGGIVSYVQRENNHPSYGSNGADGDISVVTLITPLVYSPVVQAGTIIVQGADVPDNTPVVHTGWGATSYGGPASDVLQDVTIYTINRELCAARYQATLFPQIVSENMICVGLLDVGGADACQGDSGGPLYYGNIIIGVVSWGQSCAQAQFPGVNTRVASYTDWIVANVV